jgi:hypothetical protein
MGRGLVATAPYFGERVRRQEQVRQDGAIIADRGYDDINNERIRERWLTPMQSTVGPYMNHMTPPPASSIARIGFWSGLAAFVSAVAYDVVQISQIVGVLHFPLDEILIFGTSLCIIVPFILEMVAFHHSTGEHSRFWTESALIFTTMYAVFGSANYVIQLTTVIPAKLRGTLAQFQVLEQTPHSLLWDFDALAYISMAIAMLLLIPALEHAGIERWARWSCIANLIATVFAGVVYFYPTFSSNVLLVGLLWAVTAPLTMLLLALTLRRKAERA